VRGSFVAVRHFMNSIDAFRSELRSEEMPPSTALARGLGWFSLALGAAEIGAPRFLARVIGLPPSTTTSLVMRLMGAREIAAGISVLLQPRRPWPLWARVAGDALDLALLGIGASKRTSGLKLAAAIAAVGGVTALDVIASVKAQKAHAHATRPILYSVTINKPPSEVYAFYRDFERLPRFMDYLEEVEVHDNRRSRWVAKPMGTKSTVAWEAEIVEDIPGELIAWQSVQGSTIQSRGRVTFTKAPGREATEVRVEMQLGVGGVGASAALARFFSKPQIKGDLRRLKQVMETGEVLISDATVTRRPHPAQPSEREVIDANARHDLPIFVPNPPTATKGVTR
jgi:uncharacterized membrane protein